MGHVSEVEWVAGEVGADDGGEFQYMFVEKALKFAPVGAISERKEVFLRAFRPLGTLSGTQIRCFDPT